LSIALSSSPARRSALNRISVANSINSVSWACFAYVWNYHSVANVLDIINFDALGQGCASTGISDKGIEGGVHL